MDRKGVKYWGILLGIFLVVWICVRYLLPIALPFLLGTLVAAAAEPGVHFLVNRGKMGRGWASFLVITLGFFMLLAGIWILGALVYREMSLVAAEVPGMLQGISMAVEQIRLRAVDLAARAPDGLQPALVRGITDLFAEGSVLLEKTASGVFSIAGSVMGELPGGAMLIGTAVISSYMISAQFPSLRRKLQKWVTRQRLQTWLMAVGRIKKTVGDWLKAQLKLSGVTLVIVLAGMLILRIRNPFFWAVVVALVDAVPLLGTGIILLPWALFALLQGEGARALGLTGVYVTAMLVRSGLEPKLVGRHLGINPLVTLVALYAGYRIWGVGGMIMAPILTVTARQLAELRD